MCNFKYCRNLFSLFLYLFIAIVWFWYQKYEIYEDKTYAVMKNGCEFEVGGNYRPGPYTQKSIPMCIKPEYTEKMDRLVNQMKWYSERYDHASMFGAEFGSNVQVGYVRDIDLVFVNPVITPASDSKIECEVIVGKYPQKIKKHQFIKLNYLDVSLSPREDVFKNKHACLIQITLDNF